MHMPRVTSPFLHFMPAVPAFKRFDGAAVLHYRPSNECDSLPILFIVLTDKNGVKNRYELRNPAWRSWDHVDAWARAKGDRVRIAGVIKPVTALTVTQQPSDHVWNHLYANTHVEIEAHVSEYRMAGIIVIDSISAIADRENPRPCDQW